MQTKTHKALQRRIAILQFIQAYNTRTAFSPTFRDIARAVHFASIASVHSYVNALRTEGYITFNDGQPRTLALTEKAKQLLNTLEDK